jgi:hypothetical protein
MQGKTRTISRQDCEKSRVRPCDHGFIQKSADFPACFDGNNPSQTIIFCSRRRIRFQRAYRKEEIPVQWLGRMARFNLVKVRRAMERKARAMPNNLCTKSRAEFVRAR